MNLVLRYCGIAVPWYCIIICGIAVLQYHGITVSQYHGIMVSRYHGITVSRYHGIKHDSMGALNTHIFSMGSIVIYVIQYKLRSGPILFSRYRGIAVPFFWTIYYIGKWIDNHHFTLYLLNVVWVRVRVVIGEYKSF